MAESMLERFFRPDLTLYWKGRQGKFSDAYYPDNKIRDEQLCWQLIREAGLPTQGIKPSVTFELMDQFEIAAGNHGLCIETIGVPSHLEDTAEIVVTEGV
jgi:hypothetical protein